MIALTGQLLLCYGIIGMIMSGLLGANPFRQGIEKTRLALFSLFVVFWFPLALLALIAAPFIHSVMVQEQE
ncbi:MAG: hypothetical protein ABF608_04955 [Sporolactobacillus sp.]